MDNKLNLPWANWFNGVEVMDFEMVSLNYLVESARELFNIIQF
jgi:hypothetical protein